MADAEQQQQQPALTTEEREAISDGNGNADANADEENDEDLEFGLNDPFAVVIPRVAPPDADVFLAARLGDCARLREILAESPELVNSRDRFDATVSFFSSFFCFLFTFPSSFLSLSPLNSLPLSLSPLSAPPPRLALRLPRRRQPPHRVRGPLRRLDLRRRPRFLRRIERADQGRVEEG